MSLVSRRNRTLGLGNLWLFWKELLSLGLFLLLAAIHPVLGLPSPGQGDKKIPESPPSPRWVGGVGVLLRQAFSV